MQRSTIIKSVYIKKLQFPFPSNEIYISCVHSPVTQSSSKEVKVKSNYSSDLSPRDGDFMNELVIITGEWTVTFSSE